MAETRKASASRTGETSKRSSRPAKKAAAKTSARRTSGSGGSSGKATPATVAKQTARQLHELIGRDPEGVTGLERSDDGWRVQVEVVEVRRIPDSADILALYEVDVDTSGDMTGYRRLVRYARGRSFSDQS